MANTASLKPFRKGHDPRRNTKGRPKTFDKLRSLAQMIAVEDGITTDEGILSNVEVILRGMMKADPKLFLEIAYGKVPTDINLRADSKHTLTIRELTQGGDSD